MVSTTVTPLNLPAAPAALLVSPRTAGAGVARGGGAPPGRAPRPPGPPRAGAPPGTSRRAVPVGVEPAQRPRRHRGDRREQHVVPGGGGGEAAGEQSQRGERLHRLP